MAMFNFEIGGESIEDVQERLMKMLGPQMATQQQAGPMMPDQERPDITAAQAGTGMMPLQPAERLAALLAHPETKETAQKMLQQNMGLQGKGTQSPSSVREWQFYETLSPKDQKRYKQMKRGTTALQMIAGVPNIVDRVTEKVTPLSTLVEESEAKSELSKGTSQGTATSAAIKSALNRSQKISENIINLRKVVDLVGDGAETGPLAAKLPSFRAASIRLDDMRRRLGLDVLGSVTFGSLSKDELNMALDTALPNALEGPDLVKWANDKITAQDKLRKYLEDQAVFLGKPGGSLPKWIEHQRTLKTDKQSKVPQTAIDFLKANPSTIDLFRDKYGYTPEGF